MWTKNSLLIIPALLAVLFIHSCTSQRLTTGEKPNRRLSTNKIIDSVLLQKLKFEYFSTKIAADAEFGDNSLSFKVNLKIRKDSVIWLYITKLNIPFVRAVVTKDSVKWVILQGKEEGYYARAFNHINDMFDTELDYNMLQDLLVGSPMSFDEEEKYKSPKDSAYYYLTTHRKRKLRRALEHDHVYKKQPVIYQYRFYPKNFKPNQVWINDMNDTTVLDVVYPAYDGLDSIPTPAVLEINASKAAKKVKLKLEYKRTKLNEKTEFPFNIPDGYEKK